MYKAKLGYIKLTKKKRHLTPKCSCRVLYVCIKILNYTRYLTGNQWRSFNIVVMWLRRVVFGVHEFEKSFQAANELWIRVGVDNYFRQISVHTIANCQQAERSKAMMKFHAIRGCDTLSSILNKGKMPTRSAWTVRSDVTGALTTFSSQPVQGDPESMTAWARKIHHHHVQYNKYHVQSWWGSGLQPLRKFL